MKKFIFTLTTLFSLMFASICIAADGSYIGSEQKAAEIFADGLLRLSETDARYNYVAKYFEDNLKKKFDEKQFDQMRDFLRNQCGKLSNLEFKALRREAEGDTLYYRAQGTKIPGVLLNVHFNKDKEIVQFDVGPDTETNQKTTDK